MTLRCGTVVLYGLDIMDIVALLTTGPSFIILIHTIIQSVTNIMDLDILVVRYGACDMIFAQTICWRENSITRITQ